MKKILCILLVSLVIFAGCENKNESKTAQVAKAKETYNSLINTLSADNASMPNTKDTLEKDMGGEDFDFFSQPCVVKFDGISTLSDLISKEEWQKWCEQKDKDFFEGNTTDISDYLNVYSFITDFNIPDETVRECLVKEREMFISMQDEYNLDLSNEYYTDEEIDLLLSKDKAKIVEHFKGTNSIVKGDKIYSMDWIYKHNINDYVKEDLPCKLIEKQKEAYQQTLDKKVALKAMDKKIYDYSLSYSFKEEKMSESNKAKFEITKEYNSYDIIFLSSHTIQDYANVGITIEDLKILLEEMKDYDYTAEYGWIESTYNRMVQDSISEK